MGKHAGLSLAKFQGEIITGKFLFFYRKEGAKTIVTLKEDYCLPIIPGQGPVVT